MHNFSTKTLNILKAAGWYSGRCIDITMYEKSLEQAGFILYDAPRDFLKEFGGLSLSISYPEDPAGVSPRIVTFDPSSELESFDCEWLIDYKKILPNENLVVIGDSGKHMTLFLSDLGKMYGGYDQFFCLLGNSPFEAIERRSISVVPLKVLRD